MGASKSALRHLYAAIQIFRRYQLQLSSTDHKNIIPIHDVILRFDFLALKLIPYASSCFSSCSSIPLMEAPFWSREPDDFSVSPHKKHGGSSVTTERHRLIQLVSGHNKFSKVVWGSWYPTNNRPTRDELAGFQAEMLLWKSTSPETFACCVSDLDSVRASSIEGVDLLPIPPVPLHFTSVEAAVNVIMYNGYLGCALAMLSTTDSDPLEREIEAYNYVYQNMCIASGLLYRDPGQGTYDYDYKPCDSIDMGISLFLYNAARRCFSAEWQEWTQAALHAIGQEGLSNAHSLANTLAIMRPLEKILPQNVLSKDSILRTKSPLGHIRDRLVPTLKPVGDEGGFSAHFLRYGATEEDSDESVIRIVGRASWRQDDEGNILGLEIDSTAGGNASLDEDKDEDGFRAWKEKVEAGWYGFV